MRASALLLIVPIFLTACGDNGRGGRGYVVIVPRDGSTAATQDSGRVEEPHDAGGEADAENNADADAPWERDAETFPDAGLEDARTFPDASPPDTGRADTGGFPDLGIPWPPADAGRPDSGRPDSGQADSGTPPQFQTTVSVTVPGASQVLINLNPPVASDPLSFSTELTYDNVGPGSENISILSVDVLALIINLQTFQAGPSYNAPVGVTTHTVSKNAGTGPAISMPETYCGYPAIIMIEFSNGSSVQDFGMITCSP